MLNVTNSPTVNVIQLTAKCSSLSRGVFREKYFLSVLEDQVKRAEEEENLGLNAV